VFELLIFSIYSHGQSIFPNNSISFAWTGFVPETDSHDVVTKLWRMNSIEEFHQESKKMKVVSFMVALATVMFLLIHTIRMKTLGW
jgi:hypothetical protein